MLRVFALASLLLLAGCSTPPKEGSASFIVNQSGGASQQAPGKSYALNTTRINPVKGYVLGGDNQTGVNLTFGPDTKVQDVLGKEQPLKDGELRLNGKIYPLESGEIVLQTLQQNFVRGNFNAKVKDGQPPWEVVGSFDAVLE